MDDSDYGEELEWDDEELGIKLAAIETAAASHSSARSESGPRRTHLEIAVDNDPSAASASDATQDPHASENALGHLNVVAGRANAPERSLWERFRKRRGWGGLSVSDLVSPSWCEVQHAYRLGFKSHLPPDQRPTEITTSSGAIVQLDTTRAKAREVILDGGKKVHSALEKEAMGDVDEVKVKVQRPEEWWSLRILNTIVCLEALIDNGLAREIPVFGFVDDFLVFGVIDEIKRREYTVKPPPAPPTPKKRKVQAAQKDEDDHKQLKLESFFKSPSSKGKEKAVETDEPVPASIPHIPEPTTRTGFVVSDSKTRYNRSLPPKSETRASRLQVMLYHRLLSSLLVAPEGEHEDQPAESVSIEAKTKSPPTLAFDWDRLYRQLHLEPNIELSEEFVASIQPVITGSSLESSLGNATTLLQFVAALTRYAELLGATPGASPFEPELEIVYRLRNSVKKWKPRKKTRKEREDLDMQRAIAESLQAAQRGYVPDEDEEELERALSLSLEGATLAAPVAHELEKLIELDGNPIDELPDPMLDGIDLTAQPTAFSDIPFTAENGDGRQLHPSPNGALDLPSNSQAAPAVAQYSLRPRRRRQPSDTRRSASAKRPRSAAAATSEGRTSEAVQAPPAVPAATPSSSPPSSPSEDIAEGSLIGTERFRNNPVELDRWLVDVVRLWKGEREPRGVSLEQTRRCRTCEFEESCEWRLKKASETVEQARARSSGGQKETP